MRSGYVWIVLTTVATAMLSSADTGASAVQAAAKTITQARQIPNTFDRVTLLVDWVEKGTAPGKSITVTGGGRSLPMCSYPEYPKYNDGPADAAGSYQCSVR